ncbi:uncharacterized protein LOC115791235 [Archocentrus centrarchus]|uniref:uncharacterized protein LOC115791235 n=1 Tax=Archocentrus centrarchus TaxID=63155 RepID=UPI0011EA2CA0|nr:uncharacterized protein LOC115791235 [Archocentrus centrarchus]
MEAASSVTATFFSFDNLESVKVLVTTFQNEKETSKKILHVSSTKNLIEQTLAQQSGCVLDRILKYKSDFLEYTDIDTNVEIKDFDRFHMFLSTRGPLMEASLEEINQNQPHTNRGEDSQPLQSLLMKKAPQILQEYETTGFLSVQLRKLLVKTCVGDLVEKCGFYPLNEDKLALARSVIATFPSLSVQVAGQGERFVSEQVKQHITDIQCY